MSVKGLSANAVLREKLLDANVAEISEHEEAAIKARMAAIDKLFKDTLRAKYKLEIQLHQKRSTWKPFVGVMYFLLSGDKFHGGGDSKIYLCADRGCHGVINPPDHTVNDLDDTSTKVPKAKVICPKCGRMYFATDLWGERLLNLTCGGWAKALYENFSYLDMNADISLIFHHDDLHTQTGLEIEKNANSDIINKARHVRERAIYPLRNIITDVSNGSNLYNRFFAFMKES